MTRRVPHPPIITTDAWGARPPRHPITPAGRPSRILVHHTAGHHPEVSVPADESREEAIRYAREIQAFHMRPGGLGSPAGGIDSGHNYLVCRNGLILVGRHHSFTMNLQGLHVVSAHCPGQNDQVGIEHEHLHEQRMTAAQLQSSAALCAWLIDRCGMGQPSSAIRMHKDFFPTACPGELAGQVPALRGLVSVILRGI